MKKIIIILSVSLTLILVGILYGNNSKPVQDEMMILEEAYASQCPEQIPDVILDPMVGYPVF